METMGRAKRPRRFFTKEFKAELRAGLSAGEPVDEDGDLFGATVILAARISSEAGPGEVLVPDHVRHLLAGKGFIFEERGEFRPKGFGTGSAQPTTAD
jgi:class 3 adenylate cyclase